MEARVIDKIEIVADNTPAGCEEGFVQLKRYRLKNLYKDGSSSREYNCDIILRKGIDAVGVLLYSIREDGGIDVYLVETLRPTVILRPWGKEDSPYLYEIVAGIIEPEDASGKEGILQRAAEEAFEEAGFQIDTKDIFFLGGAVYPSPGVHTEKLYFVAAKVDASTQKEPTKDGSVYEENSSVVRLDLWAAIRMCEDGRIKDAKTEIALFRLARRLLSGGSTGDRNKEALE